MFQESLVESTSLLRGRNRWPAVISFALQAAFAAALIVVPLMHPEILPVRAPRISMTAPWLKPPVVRERPVRVETSSSAENAVSAPAQSERTSTTILSVDHGQAGAAPSLSTGLNLAGSDTGSLPMLGSVGAGPQVVVRPTAAAGPMHVSSGVMAGQLLEPIQLEYPKIAILSRTQGTVVVQAVISKTGRIEGARVVSGPTMLQAAAVQAVRAARYRPFLLNGLPTEVETTIYIGFSMEN
jgi:protein TonB